MTLNVKIHQSGGFLGIRIGSAAFLCSFSERYSTWVRNLAPRGEFPRTPLLGSSANKGLIKLSDMRLLFTTIEGGS